MSQYKYFCAGQHDGCTLYVEPPRVEVLRKNGVHRFTCLNCGDIEAKQVKRTVAPMHKSNYMLITNREDLKGLNNKGGLFR